MRIRAALFTCLFLLMATTALAQDDDFYLKGYIYTLNGERQHVTKFLNVGFVDYVYTHDGLERRVAPHELYSVENRGLNNVVVTVKGQRPVRGYVHSSFPGAPIQALVGSTTAPLTFEFYDRTRGAIGRGEIEAHNVKKVVFKQ